MLRWTFACVILVITSSQSFKHHETQMQRTIENERQTIRIRNTILEELKNNGIFPHNEGDAMASSLKNKVLTETIIAPVGNSPSPVRIGLTPVQNSLASVSNDVHPTERPEMIVCIGEPAASRKNKCLVFKIGKAVKNVQQIYPYKLHLWVHIRKLHLADGKTNKSKIKQTRSADNKHGITKTSHKGGGQRNKERERRKKNKQIKIFVSNGSKVLVKMRMLIKETNWYKIDLPISQLPEVIRANDSLQLCFKCKRCSTKVKLDLYQKPTMRSDKEKVKEAKIPFIHIETKPYLPQTNYRNKRSVDTYKKMHSHFDVNMLKQSCCVEEIYTESMSSLSPNILYPHSVNISYCGTIVADTGQYRRNKPLLSLRSKTTENREYKCYPREFKSLSLLIFDKNQNVKDVIIRDVMPTGCNCSRD